MKKANLFSVVMVVLTGATWRANAGLVSGPDIIAAPASVVNDPPGAVNTAQQAFDEQQGVVLPAALAVDSGVLAAGTTVNSHMIFLNIDGAGSASDLGVEWTFDGPIIGVMSDQGGVLEAASSALLGAAGTIYPAAFASRGLESNDGYAVAGNKITVSMSVSQPGDWIRVITLQVDPCSANQIGGSVFLTGHDPDFHAFLGGNMVGARNINNRAIDFITNPAFNTFESVGISKFLFVQSNIVPPGGHTNGLNGIIASGHVNGTDFEQHNAGTLQGELDRLGTKYSAIVVASDFGGILTQAELNILNARSSDIIAFLNAGGGLYAMAESNSQAGLTPAGGHFGFLPFVVSSTAFNQSEVGNTVTPFGAGLGLTNADVNGNASHNVFTATSGLSIVDIDNETPPNILSLAGRGVIDPDIGVLSDCNGNGVLDSCDVDPTDPDGNGEVSADCNGNGVPDECDIDPLDPDGNGEVSEDVNGDGVPDECNLPPDCSGASPSLATLWPPNHKFVPITILGITDPDGDPIAVTIDSIFQDEPVLANGEGAGATSPDGDGVGTGSAQVRAERNGNPGTPGNGRVYHIGFTADDGNGGTCGGVVRVCVPHDQRPAATCVDEGPLYDSTAP